MIGIVISGHGQFATGIKSALELIMGKQPQLAAADFREGDSPEQLRETLRAAIAQVDTGDGVVCCCDLAGGTPFNCCSLLAAHMPNVGVIGGTNLPMLMGSMFERSLNVADFVAHAMEQGSGAIKRFENKLVQKESIPDEGI